MPAERKAVGECRLTFKAYQDRRSSSPDRLSGRLSTFDCSSRPGMDSQFQSHQLCGRASRLMSFGRVKK